MNTFLVWVLALPVCLVVGFLLHGPKMASFTVWYAGGVMYFLYMCHINHSEGGVFSAYPMPWWAYLITAAYLMAPWLAIVCAYAVCSTATRLWAVWTDPQ